MAMTLRPQISLDTTDVGSKPAGIAEPDISLAAAGDTAAFERVYRSHVARVHSICLRMLGDRVDAEEATQDVFIRVWNKLSLYRGESAFTTWLHRLTVNVVLTRRKADGIRRDRHAPDEDLAFIPQRAGPVGAAMDLEAAIACLPPGARRVFILHDVEGYTHEEIGDMLGVTSGGSKAQLHRARMLLRKALNR